MPDPKKAPRCGSCGKSVWNLWLGVRFTVQDGITTWRSNFVVTQADCSLCGWHADEATKMELAALFDHQTPWVHARPSSAWLNAATLILMAHWTNKDLAIDAQGESVAVWSPRAVAWSAAGVISAIAQRYGEHDVTPEISLLAAAARFLWPDRFEPRREIVDATSRVLAVFDDWQVVHGVDAMGLDEVLKMYTLATTRASEGGAT